jgi:hypothetical protein
MKKKFYLYIGIFLSIFLFSSYFVKIEVESGANYTTLDKLLGIIIFHNPFILALYIVFCTILILKGIGKI